MYAHYNYGLIDCQCEYKEGDQEYISDTYGKVHLPQDRRRGA